MQVPDALPARGRRLRPAAAQARTPSAPRSCPATPTQVAKTRRRIEEIAAEEGLAVLGWRDVPIDPTLARRRPRAACMPRFAQLFVAGRGAAGVIGMALERRAFCLRKRAEHETDVYFPSLSCAHPRLQGHAHHRPARPSSSPTSPTSGSRRALARRALALLHQHLPVLAAGAPVPVHRPQRRDQHRAWATATGCGPARRCSPAT